MADNTPEALPLTPDQAAKIAARFVAIHPIAPRMLTTKEADQVQSLIESLTGSTAAGELQDPVELMYGYWLERLLEACMAVSAQVYRRELELNSLAVQATAAKCPGSDELREQGAVLASFTRAALGLPAAITDEILDRAGLMSRREDLEAAVQELGAPT